ncbi:unnamed protein product [Colias eurytheme]|nr:unnamed protein product [Colias eurytheme]
MVSRLVSKALGKSSDSHGNWELIHYDLYHSKSYKFQKMALYFCKFPSITQEKPQITLFTFIICNKGSKYEDETARRYCTWEKSLSLSESPLTAQTTLNPCTKELPSYKALTERCKLFEDRLQPHHPLQPSVATNPSSHIDSQRSEIEVDHVGHVEQQAGGDVHHDEDLHQHGDRGAACSRLVLVMDVIAGCDGRRGLDARKCEAPQVKGIHSWDFFFMSRNVVSNF